MKICVLITEQGDLDAAFAGLDPPQDPRRWLDGHAVDLEVIRKATADAQIAALVGRGYDVFINLCDGMPDEDTAGVEVCEALEASGAAYTGPTPRFYVITKVEMKKAALDCGVATPGFVMARGSADVERAIETLDFPMIVKHFDGYASVGMTKRSRVEGADTLRVEAERMIAAAGGALIEAFVEGDEATVLIAEVPDGPPRVYPPVLCRFPAGETFKHFDLKWVGFDGISWHPCEDEALAERLADATRRVFEALDGTGYARCDFRIDAAGRVWFLEMNTTCGIFYPAGSEASADMILLRHAEGHRGFLDVIMRGALARRAAAG